MRAASISYGRAPPSASSARLRSDLDGFAVDLHGLVSLGYCFSKRTVLHLLRKERVSRAVVALGSNDDTFLDGLSDALKHGDEALCLAPDMAGVGVAGRLLGATAPPLDETFAPFLKWGPLGTGALAAGLGISPQNAKDRVDRLFEFGVANREKVASATEGHES